MSMPSIAGREWRIAVFGAVAQLLCLALAPAVEATTVAPMEPAALAQASDLVTVIEVRSASSAWVGRRIFTFYEADVIELWSARDAAAPRRVLLALPGGVVGEIGQRVPGMPLLDVGARYAACLGKDNGPRGARGIMGYWQGIWRVEQGATVGFGHEGPNVQPGMSLEDLRQRLTVAR